MICLISIYIIYFKVELPDQYAEPVIRRPQSTSLVNMRTLP